MNSWAHGIVLFADVVKSTKASAAAVAWLEQLSAMLDQVYGPRLLAPFEFTQGDELQGLLELDADPFLAVLQATLRPHDGDEAVPRMRWVLVAGEIDPGHGPATRRTGPAFIRARAALEAAKRQKDGLVCRTPNAHANALLDGTAPPLAAMIDAMTDRQREVARLSLVDGLRQSEIADHLRIARATVSVSSARGDVRNLSRLLGAVRTLWADGLAAEDATR